MSLSLPNVLDSTGRVLPLERQLASGGEGAVFTLRNDTDRVAKLYHKPPTAQTVEKLTAMTQLSRPELQKVAAWPTELLRDARSRQISGFTMPRLNECKPIQELYNPSQRLKSFPKAGWAFQVRVAANLAAAFDEVHKAGCLVGDVNQSNALVTPQAFVKLIDCDSFQVIAGNRQYLCEVGVPHYTPPELQGKSLRGLVRTENHDRFGLAVLIYQLLFVGRHPYAGIYTGTGDPSFEELITQYRFAQGPMAHNWGMKPPPHTPTFADIPPDLGLLLRKAFERGSENGSRPSPMQWLTSVKALEKSTLVCTADPGHKHWSGASKCVWCRLEQNGGPEYYFGVAGGAGTFQVDETKLLENLRRLEACQFKMYRYDRAQFEPKIAPEPTPVPEGLDKHKYTMQIIGCAAALCVLLMPFGVIRGEICLTGSIGLVVFGIWIFILATISPRTKEYQKRKFREGRSYRVLHHTEESWETVVEEYRQSHRRLSGRIENFARDCRSLETEHAFEEKTLRDKSEVLARIRHLKLQGINDEYIPNFGAHRKQVLAQNGICTAADIDRNRIMSIPGFGEVMTQCLLDWRKKKEREFRFNPATALSASDQKALALKFRARQQSLLAKMTEKVAELESLAPACQIALDELKPRLSEAIRNWQQAKADLDELKRVRI